MKKQFLLLIIFILGNCGSFMMNHADAHTTSGIHMISNSFELKESRWLKILAKDTVQGIDLSHYSGFADWQMVANNDAIDFVILRSTVGKDSIDNNYANHLAEIMKTDLIVGTYHYLRSFEDPIEQAKHYLKHTQFLEDDLRPVLDVEYKRKNRHPDSLRSDVKKWLDHVETETGRKPIIYTYLNFYRHYFDGHEEFEDYPLWIARYSDRPDRVDEVFAFADMHQFTDTFVVEGIERPVDGNKSLIKNFLGLLP